MHNFCPLPAGVTQAAPNLFEPSSREPREHDQWLRHTKRSVDFAAQVGSPVLVCHLGSVIFFWFNPAASIRRYLAEAPRCDPGDDKEYEALLAKCDGEAAQADGPVLGADAWRACRQIADYAQEKGVTARRSRTARSSRSFRSTPTFRSSWPPFRPMRPSATGTTPGHAQLKQDLGLLDHRQHLERNAPAPGGLPPARCRRRRARPPAGGAGQVDFRMVSGFWRPEHRLTLELGPRVSADDVSVSKSRVEDPAGVARVRPAPAGSPAPTAGGGRTGRSVSSWRAAPRRGPDRVPAPGPEARWIDSVDPVAGDARASSWPGAFPGGPRPS